MIVKCAYESHAQIGRLIVGLAVAAGGRKASWKLAALSFLACLSVRTGGGPRIVYACAKLKAIWLYHSSSGSAFPEQRWSHAGSDGQVGKSFLGCDMGEPRWRNPLSA